MVFVRLAFFLLRITCMSYLMSEFSTHWTAERDKKCAT